MKRKAIRKPKNVSSPAILCEPQHECFANEDLMLTIFILLHPLDLGRAQFVNTRWRKISSSPTLWKYMSENYLANFVPVDCTSIEFGLEYLKQNALIQSTCQEICSDPKRGWLRPVFHVAKVILFISEHL